jgi:hypothetical protein
MIYVIQVRRRQKIGYDLQHVHLFSAEIDEPLKAVQQLYDLFAEKFPHPEYQLSVFQKITRLERIAT